MKNKNMQQIVLARPSKLPNRPQRPENKTQSQLVWSFESQSRVKVKVVKWCRKKWFDHNLMYIYHKQYEILQKKSPKQLKHSISVISHWKGTKAMQTQTLKRLVKINFLRK